MMAALRQLILRLTELSRNRLMTWNRNLPLTQTVRSSRRISHGLAAARLFGLSALLLSLGLICEPVAATAQALGPITEKSDSKPYDKDLLRLSEILGAIHYLRALCGADEGQKWREQMRALVESEGTSALRRAKLVKSFNTGYRGYRRTYRSCTEPATLAIERFLKEGADLSEKIATKNR